MKKLHTRTKIGLLLTIVGLLGIVSPIAYYHYVLPHSQVVQPIIIAPVNQQLAAATKTEQVIAGHPNFLTIPSLDMAFAVTDGVYDKKTGDWTLSNDHVQYAAVTALPNNKMGNTFLYGHATRRVFGRLPQIKQGSEAFIKTDNGYTFVYQLVDVKNHDPNDVSIFAYEGAPQLTIQTCSGAWNQYREFFTFKFVRYDKDGQLASVTKNP